MTTKRRLVVLLVILLLLGGLLSGWGAEGAEGAGERVQQHLGASGASNTAVARSSGTQGSDGTCCWRWFCIEKISMPEGQVWDWGGWIRSEFWSGLTRESYYSSPDAPELAWSSTAKNLRDCPLECEESPCGNAEYIFRGELSVSNQTGFTAELWEEGYEPGSSHLAGGGNIVGDWILHMQLLDPHHGNQLAERSVSWQGTVDDAIVQRVWYERPQDFAPWSTLKYPLREWASTFLGKELDDFLHDYERLPEQAQIEPEEKEVMKGDTMTIRLNDIVDGDGHAPHSWWRVFVKVEHGEILHAPETQGEYSVFRVGGGVVDIEYQAPEDCPDDKTETITVFNTCNMKENLIGTPEKEIASGEFEIKCPEFEIEYDQQGNLGGIVGLGSVTTGRIPIFVRVDGEGYYRLEGEGALDLTGTLAGGLSVAGYVGAKWSTDGPGKGTVAVVVDGDLVDVGGDVYELYLTWHERWYDTWDTPTLHAKVWAADHYEEVTEPWVVDPVETEWDLVFPGEDGYSEDFSMSLYELSCRTTWTLHVLEE